MNRRLFAATLFLITTLIPFHSWAILIPDPGFCPQATLMPPKEAYQDPKLGPIELSFWYNYSNATYDTIPQTFSNQWVVGKWYQNAPAQIAKSSSNSSDGIQTLKLDKLLVKDESEGCYCGDIAGFTKCWCNGPWANWWMEIFPLSDHPLCDLFTGGQKRSCQHSAFLNKNHSMNPAGIKLILENPPIQEKGAFTPGTEIRKSHISGPTLNDNKANCEWYEVGTQITSPTGEKYTIGPQYIDYENYVLWDWDNWCYPVSDYAPKGGKCADALWITFKESDEGIDDDYVLTDIHLKKGNSIISESDYARAWFQDTYYGADFDNDGLINEDEYETETDPKNADMDSDGLKDGQEVKTTNTDPKKSDSDEDGLSDGNEVNQYKSNPLAKDTDNDGINDGDEVNKYGSDPLSDDSDDDGISDSDEIASGTNPIVNEAVLIPVFALLLSDDEEKFPPPTITGVPTVPILTVPKNNVMTVSQNTVIKSESGLASVKMECGGGIPITGAPIFVPAFAKYIYSFNIQIGPADVAALCQISATDVVGQTTAVPFQVMPGQSVD